MSRKIDFENFRPKLKPGRLIPQSAYLIFEEEKDREQIVLPIEMADFILLCNGRFSIRQIIEKIFRRRGFVHFRALFAVVHQLRDYGFFINGEDLQVANGWASYNQRILSLGKHFSLLKRRYCIQARALHFYFFALFFILLGGLSLHQLNWPPISSDFAFVNGSYLWGWGVAMVCSSIMFSFQGLFKAVSQILLTGQFFGLSIFISPFGLILRTNDEPIFLIANKLYLILYHVALLLFPFVVIWPMAYLWPELHVHLTGLAIVNLLVQASPLGLSEFTRLSRSILSLDQSDTVAGYIRHDSLLALISPLGEAKRARKWRRRFLMYFWSWTLVTFYFLMESLKNIGTRLSEDAVGALIVWSIVFFLSAWILKQVVVPFGNSLVIPAKYLYRSWLGMWRRNKKITSDSMVDVLSQLPLFSYFSNQLLQKIIEESLLYKAKKGTRIITQGEIGRHLYILLRGRVVVEKNSIADGRMKLTTLHATSIFGEIAIVEESERAADVVALEDVSLLRVPAVVLRSLANESQNEREINAFCNAVIVNQFFASAPIFKDLPEEVINNIVTRSFMRNFAAGDVVIKQGEVGKSFFMVLRGSVKVLVNDKLVKVIKQGGFFGEIAIFADIPRTATVVTEGPALLFEMAASSFWEVLCQNVELAMFIEAVSEMRLREDISGALLEKGATDLKKVS